MHWRMYLNPYSSNQQILNCAAWRGLIYTIIQKRRNGSGVGKDACFIGRGGTHTKNARSVDQMRTHQFYQEYPAEGVEKIGGIGDFFKYLEMYRGMAFSKKEDISPLCSEGADNSLFVWSKQSIEMLKKRDGRFQNEQLLAISDLWEICDDLSLAKYQNVSASLGMEVLGLRIYWDFCLKLCRLT